MSFSILSIFEYFQFLFGATFLKHSVDISKAFDRMWYEVVLFKLSQNRISKNFSYQIFC